MECDCEFHKAQRHIFSNLEFLGGLFGLALAALATSNASSTPIVPDDADGTKF